MDGEHSDLQCGKKKQALGNWLGWSTTLEQVRLIGTDRHLKGENHHKNRTQE